MRHVESQSKCLKKDYTTLALTEGLRRLISKDVCSSTTNILKVRRCSRPLHLLVLGLVAEAPITTRRTEAQDISRVVCGEVVLWPEAFLILGHLIIR